MKIINAKEVKERLENNPKLSLVMVLNNEAFEKAHIPGSLNIGKGQSFDHLDRNEEIIVYCSDEACTASYHAYNALVHAGFKNVYRFAGGMMEWSNAGYELTTNHAS